MSLWFAVVLAGIGTYLLRVSLIAVIHRFQVSARVEDAMRLIAPAVLAALVANGLLLSAGGLRPLDTWHAAAVVAAAIAWWTRSVGWTLAGGMAALWLFQLVA